MASVRVRFAPSPTGYLHVGGARTALFNWLYARKTGGVFVLRIEDTDKERSTEAHTQVILDGLRWLGIGYDEGPFFQGQSYGRHRADAEGLVAAGRAYRCFCTREELEASRQAAEKGGAGFRYDGRCGRLAPAEVERKLAAGMPFSLRLRMPDEEIAWEDAVHGRISFQGRDLDDFIILRSDGTPIYNLAVVSDDIEMQITHVIRGDDHISNTPKQIALYRALGHAPPIFAHVPMILGSDGERLSKRHGAVSVMQYAEDGFLPGALLNYLARLGWSHGNDEVFSLEQFVDWFDLEHISRSPAQFNPEKLAWLDQQHLKVRDDRMLAEEVAPRLAARGIGTAAGPSLEKVAALYKDRVSTLNELADAVEPFYVEVYPGAELLAQHVTEAACDALRDLRTRLETTVWEKAQLNQALKDVVAARGLKLPQLAIPLRVVLTGQPQTPSIDAVLEAFGREVVLARLGRHA